MKIYRNIIITIWVIIALVLTIVQLSVDPFVKTFVTNNYPTQEEYSDWKQYSHEVAKNLDTEVITDEEVRAEFTIKTENMVVYIYSRKYGLELETTYPIYCEVQDNNIVMNVDYENTQYSVVYGAIAPGYYKEITFFMSIVGYSIFGAALTAPIYLIYLIPKGIYSLIQNIKTKKQN